MSYNSNYTPPPDESQEEIEMPGYPIFRETAYMVETLRNDADAGRVFRAANAYFLFGELPDPPFTDKRMKDVFNKIRDNIDHSAEKYRKRVQRNRENGKKGGRPQK